MITLEPGSDRRIKVIADDIPRLVEANQDTITRYRLAMAYHVVSEKIQSIAKGNFAAIFPDAAESELSVMADYILTYMTYEDAVAHALDSESPDAAMQRFREHKIVNGKLKKLYSENSGVQLTEEYTVLLKAIDDAYCLFTEGSYKDSYLLCDSIIKVIENGTEKEFTENTT